MLIYYSGISTFVFAIRSMFNLYGTIQSNPGKYRQLSCGESLISVYNCPLEEKMVDVWSHHNYIVYVMEGRKIWHTAGGSYDLTKGNCVFVRKGACIVEQFLDVTFCLIIFFIPDDFICKVLASKSTPIRPPGQSFHPVMPVDVTPSVSIFFQSMMPHFEAGRQPDQAILELKFRELILHIADTPVNAEILTYFCSLLKAPAAVSLQKIMEENFCFNLKLDEFARLSNRSLSAFKRDFQKQFSNTPGKWLTEKRLNHAMHLLSHQGKTVGEAAFESGFENQSHFSRAFKIRFGISPATVKQAEKA